MERNTPTTIDQLQAGDRFYKAGDKNKTVYEKIFCKEWGKYLATTESDLHPVPFTKNINLIFLRSRIS